MVAARHLNPWAPVFFKPRTLIEKCISLVKPVYRDKCANRCIPCDKVLQVLNLLRILAILAHSCNCPSAHKVASVSSLSIYDPAVPFADCKYIVSRIGKANDQFWDWDWSVCQLEKFSVIDHLFDKLVHCTTHFDMPMPTKVALEWIISLECLSTNAHL